MGQMFDWLIIPNDNAIANIIPNNTFTYDFFNLSKTKCLKYGRREYGINLVWDDPAPPEANIQFQRESGSNAPLRYEELFAIKVRNGGFLHYEEREYGINLKWSNTPIFEWQFKGDGSGSGDIVQIGSMVGLFNIVSNDYLFYDPRRYGIDLKWLRDEGKFNSKPWYEDVADFVGGLVSDIINILKEAINRLLGLADLVLTFFGIMLPKKIRLQVVILRDESSKALLGDEGLPPMERQAELKQIEDAIALARDVFKKQVNTSIHAADGQMIVTLDYSSPTAALNVECGCGAITEDLYKEAGRFFRRHRATNLSGLLTGYGAPVTIFVVRDVKDNIGCSIGPLSDYVTVDLDGMAYRPTAKEFDEERPRTLTHELGHACGLWHPLINALHTANLMIPNPARGLFLELHQRAIFRNSRHVTFL